MKFYPAKFSGERPSSFYPSAISKGKFGRVNVVATPIGNLKDITFRAIEVLGLVDYILCEDTRRTIKLLNHYNIKKPLISYHRHSKIGKSDQIIEILRSGKDLALVSDSGTPGIADPGNKLIEELVGVFGDELEIVPIPGSSAISALASVAGINMDSFIFLGFPPQKKGRKTFFSDLKKYDVPVVIYESPHRLIKALTELSKTFPSAKIILGKELTKMFEKVYRGTAQEVLTAVTKDGARGEYVLIISNF